MLRSTVVLVLLLFVAQAHGNESLSNPVGDAQDSMDKRVQKLVNKLTDKLSERTLRVSHLQHSELEDAVVGKSGHLATRPCRGPSYSPPAVSSSGLAFFLPSSSRPQVAATVPQRGCGILCALGCDDAHMPVTARPLSRRHAGLAGVLGGFAAVAAQLSQLSPAQAASESKFCEPDCMYDCVVGVGFSEEYCQKNCGDACSLVGKQYDIEREKLYAQQEVDEAKATQEAIERLRMEEEEAKNKGGGLFR